MDVRGPAASAVSAVSGVDDWSSSAAIDITAGWQSNMSNDITQQPIVVHAIDKCRGAVGG